MIEACVPARNHGEGRSGRMDLEQTFDGLARLEPRLRALEADAREAAADGRGFWPDRCYARHFRWRVWWIVSNW